MTDEVKLARMRFLINRLPMARLRVDRALAKATRMTVQLSGMPGGGGGCGPVECGAIALDEAKTALADMRKELENLRKWLEPMIATLPFPLQRTVMRLRYLEGMSAQDIAWRLNYSRQHVYRVLRGAEERI